MTINPDWIFWPVLAHMALVVFLYLKLANAKIAAVVAGNVDEKRRALHDDAWPDNVLKISNNLNNQFQLPLAFYTVSLLLWVLNAISWPILILAWAFTLGRYAHTYIHIGSNIIRYRFEVFRATAFIFFAMVIMVGVTLVQRSGLQP